MPDGALTVRVRDGKMSAVDGPFMETKEMLGGFALTAQPTEQRFLTRRLEQLGPPARPERFGGGQGPG